MKSIDYVIPNYENPKLLEQCINSIRKFSNSRIIVCDDNSSSQDLIQIVQICKKTPNVSLRTNFWNSGFGYSCNMGIANSTADIVILVNSDIIMTESIQKETIRIFESDEKIGVVGYLLYYPNGLIQHGGHYVPKKTGYKFLGHRDYQLPKDQAKEALESGYIISVTGALMAIRKDMFNKIGGFKKEYKLGSEDAEYCYRTWHTGYRVYYTSAVSAIHAEGFTRGKNDYEKDQRMTLMTERNTLSQFMQDIALYDFPEIERQLLKAKGVEVGPRPYRVGINRAGALGDAIMATGVIAKIKEENPGVEIYVSTLCPFPFIANTNVKKIFNNKKQMIEQVDTYFDLDLAYEKKPKIKVIDAYAQEIFDEYKEEEIRPTLNSILESRDKVQKEVLSKIPKGKIAVIHAGRGFWEMKHWDRFKYILVAQYLKSIGYNVVTVGRHDDLLIEGTINLVNRLDQQDVFELIKMSDLFVGIDGGVMHMAQCTETPIVAIFSVADPKCFIWREENTVAVEPRSECRYCRNKVEPPVTGVICEYGDNRCIKSIEAEDVIRAIEKIVGGK